MKRTRLAHPSSAPRTWRRLSAPPPSPPEPAPPTSKRPSMRPEAPPLRFKEPEIALPIVAHAIVTPLVPDLDLPLALPHDATREEVALLETSPSDDSRVPEATPTDEPLPALAVSEASPTYEMLPPARDEEDLEADVFFKTPPPMAVDLALEEEIVAPRVSRVPSPEKRAQMTRIVGFATAFATVLCILAVVVGGRSTSSRAHATVLAAAAVAPAAAATTPVVAASEEPAPEPTLEQGFTDAAEAKRAALSALEKRRYAEAIAAGTRAIELDPTDGDAWLVLGAAQQDSGATAAALGSYERCTREAKTDPRGECAKLVRTLSRRR